MQRAAFVRVSCSTPLLSAPRAPCCARRLIDDLVRLKGCIARWEERKPAARRGRNPYDSGHDVRSARNRVRVRRRRRDHGRHRRGHPHRRGRLPRDLPVATRARCRARAGRPICERPGLRQQPDRAGQRRRTRLGATGARPDPGAASRIARSVTVALMGRTDIATRLIAAPPDAVYAALVDPDALTSWLPPDGMTATMQRYDARPGGSYRMILRYADASGAPGKTTADADVVEARFVELVPGERVVQAVDFVSDDPAFHGTMTITW